MPARSPKLPPSPAPDRENLYALWGRIAEFPASQWEDALLHLLEWIAAAIDADNVIWIGAVRVLDEENAREDPFLGWRLRGRRPLHPDPESYQKVLQAYFTSDHYGKLTPTYYSRSHKAKKEAHIGLSSQASVAGAGKFRVYRMRDGWIDFEKFRRSLHYQLYYRDAGIRDRIWIGVPVEDGRESFFLVDRFQKEGTPRRALFSLEEATLAGEAVRGIPDFHRRLFLGHGLLIGDKVLSPTEREVLKGLLTDKTEKQIAEFTGQKPATLHKYVKGIYSRFEVNGRAALMSLWLGNR